MRVRIRIIIYVYLACALSLHMHYRSPTLPQIDLLTLAFWTVNTSWETPHFWVFCASLLSDLQPQLGPQCYPAALLPSTVSSAPSLSAVVLPHRPHSLTSGPGASALLSESGDSVSSSLLFFSPSVWTLCNLHSFSNPKYYLLEWCPMKVTQNHHCSHFLPYPI